MILPNVIWNTIKEKLSFLLTGLEPPEYILVSLMFEFFWLLSRNTH